MSIHDVSFKKERNRNNVKVTSQYFNQVDENVPLSSNKKEAKKSGKFVINDE
jgi:hypothetical protein